MLTPFEYFIENSNRARTNDELVGVFLQTVKSHGYDKMIFCLQSNHTHLGLNPGVGVIQNYPQDWMKYYFESGFERIDPVITYSQNKMDTFTWAEIPQKLKLSNKQMKCLNLGIEAGLYNGVCTPLWGPGKFAGIGLATTEKIDACDSNLDLITAYCNQFYIAFERLNMKKAQEIENVYLTPKEKEILTWAISKTDDVISDILNISEETVAFHLKNIYMKLHANNRTYAVAKALCMGLITP